MHLYVLIPMVSCVLSAVLLGSIFRSGAQDRANQLVCLLLAGAILFSFCEAALVAVENPAHALFFVRLASLGWAFTGPLALQLVLQVTGVSAPRTREWLPRLWALALGFALTTQVSPWIFSAVDRREWGWTYDVGPLFPALGILHIGLAGIAIAVGVRHYRNRGQLSELQQSLWIAAFIGGAVVVGLGSHLLASASISVPRTGSLAFLMLSLLIATTSYRYGYWILAPGVLEREIFATIPNGVGLLHDDGTVRVANAGLARLMGCTPESLLGLDLRARFTQTDLLDAPDSRARECELLPFSGGPLPVSISTTRIFDRSGQDLGRVMIVADLREVVDLRNRLVTSGRLAAVGELAAGIAHEINNPLTYVRANLSMLHNEWGALRKALADGSMANDQLEATLAESEELIDESLEGVDRAAAIVRDVKSFSHAGRDGWEHTDLDPLLDSVLRVAAPQMGEAIEVKREYGTVPTILCAPQELKQVFLNLVVNASQAMHSGGAITVSSAVEEDHVVVSVKDEGCGIEPDDLARIFDPFFTTKAVGEGTGLGLALAYEIVRRHSGEVSVDSSPGEGTRFDVRFPIDVEADL